MLRRASQSGQALIIAILIGSLLVLSIPLVVFLNQLDSGHRIKTFERTKNLATARQGVAYAKAILSATPAIWQAALTNNFSAVPDCTNTTTPLIGADGSRFFISCDQTGAQPFQVHIISTALRQNNGAWLPVRSMEAYVSKRTLGVSTAEDVRASAALMMLHTPDVLDVTTPHTPPTTLNSGALIVHWGPIVSYDSSANPWFLSDPLDRATAGSPAVTFQGFPRLFSTGGITGVISRAANAIGTDLKEWWAFDSSVAPPLIDDSGVTTSYTVRAQTAAGGFPTITCSVAATIPQTQGYYDASACTTAGGVALLSGNPTPPTNSVMYINGDAEFDTLGLDLRGAGGAMVVAGNLTLNTGPGGIANTTVRFPHKAADEYAYWTPSGSGNTWPCEGNTGPTCDPTTSPTNPYAPSRINFIGFLWVKGNLKVLSNNWVLDGAVMVGDALSNTPNFIGQIQLTAGSTLMILYDEVINHQIATTKIELQTDSLREIALP